MATNIRVIHAHDFIRATAEGQIDFEKSKKLLIEVAEVGATLVGSRNSPGYSKGRG